MVDIMFWDGYGKWVINLVLSLDDNSARQTLKIKLQSVHFQSAKTMQLDCAFLLKGSATMLQGP